MHQMGFAESHASVNKKRIRKKEELEGYNIDNEVIKYIANNIKSNIRELEGALTKVVARG